MKYAHSLSVGMAKQQIYSILHLTCRRLLSPILHFPISHFTWFINYRKIPIDLAHTLPGYAASIIFLYLIRNTAAKSRFGSNSSAEIYGRRCSLSKSNGIIKMYALVIMAEHRWIICECTQVLRRQNHFHQHLPFRLRFGKCLSNQRNGSKWQIINRNFTCFLMKFMHDMHILESRFSRLMYALCLRNSFKIMTLLLSYYVLDCDYNFAIFFETICDEWMSILAERNFDKSISYSVFMVIQEMCALLFDTWKGVK